jgi:hypothetical protein
MISRRQFFQRSLQATGTSLLLSSLQGCQPAAPAYTGSLGGPNFRLGHMLRTPNFATPKESRQVPIVIVGGGAAGLSAARYLHRHTSDFVLLELNDIPGGNAIGGKNAVSAYPWGAHYLPLPDKHDQELIDFLKETQVITGYENGLPVYNEYYLCFDPKERLYIHNYWQEGIVPREGVPAADLSQIERFLALMNEYRNQKGNDGREAFTIPIDHCSTDAKYLALDNLSMEQFLMDKGFTSAYLKWYVAYCCADDFGSSLADTSAWAGIHYFCSRKGKAANTAHDTVLTWPEGNHWLIKQLQQPVQKNILTRSLIYAIEPKAQHVEVCYYDDVSGTTQKIMAQAVIMATPQYINQRLLPQTIARGIRYQAFEYAPWLVANLTLAANLNERHGETLCWDNVIYGSEALGYVNATHQHVGIQGNRHVVTYYKPLIGKDTHALRKQAHDRKHDQWRELVLRDLRHPHPHIEEGLMDLSTWVWGHGMIRPSPGFMWGPDRRAAASTLQDRIYFAHSDLSGISIFEEAFYRGHTAARQVLERL